MYTICYLKLLFSLIYGPFPYFTSEGRIVICLDNDDAGIGAVERICSGTFIWDLLRKKSVEVAVATLPSDMKDPGDFVEMRTKKKKSESVREDFQTEILDTAMLWNVWYIDRLIMKYDGDDPSSFANVCDSITTFLASNPNAADRTKQAYEAAGKLATQISGKDETATSGPLRIQLESDLLGMASKKASKKEAVQMRIEAVDKLAQNNLKGSRRAANPTGTPKTSMIRSKRIPPRSSNSSKLSNDRNKNGIKSQNQNNSNFGNQRNYQQRYNRKQEIPIARHFAGFSFNPTDASWLGITDKNVSVSNILL